MNLVIGSGSKQRTKWTVTTYKDRKILDIKKTLDSKATGILNQSILDEAIRLTKFAREKISHKKNMDSAWMAASCYFCCIGRGQTITLQEIQKIFDIVEKAEIQRLNIAITIIQEILQNKEFQIIIKSDDGYMDLSGIPYAVKICEKLKLHHWIVECVSLILYKFYEKNIMQNSVIKTRVIVIIYFVCIHGGMSNMYIDTIIDATGNSIGSLTMLKTYTAMHTMHNVGIMKYINQKRIKYGFSELPLTDKILHQNPEKIKKKTTRARARTKTNLIEQSSDEERDNPYNLPVQPKQPKKSPYHGMSTRSNAYKTMKKYQHFIENWLSENP
jgi:transcription initiation factor TFIIIB Brf1 subunit/transcription initiation factor TFIIB